MDKGMLPWQWEVISYASWDENFPILMKTGKGIMQLIQIIFSQDISACYVAKFQECTDCMRHIWWYVTLYCRQINLMKKYLATQYEVVPGFFDLLSSEPLSHPQSIVWNHGLLEIVEDWKKLGRLQFYWRMITCVRKTSPLINIIHNLLCCSLWMVGVDVILHPWHQMVLESPFNQLMKQIWSEKLMNIGMLEVICEWLYSRWGENTSVEVQLKTGILTTTSETMPNLSQRIPTRYFAIRNSVRLRVRGSSDRWPSRSLFSPWQL